MRAFTLTLTVASLSCGRGPTTDAPEPPRWVPPERWVAPEPLPTEPPRVRRTSERPLESVAPLDQARLSTTARCVIAKRDALDRDCRFHAAPSDDVCVCAASTCLDSSQATCGDVTARAHVLGFAISTSTATACAAAEHDGQLRCWAAHGTAGAASIRDACDGATCWCIAAVECAPS